jgi:hypothetical protein
LLVLPSVHVLAIEVEVSASFYQESNPTAINIVLCTRATTDDKLAECKHADFDQTIVQAKSHA